MEKAGKARGAKPRSVWTTIPTLVYAMLAVILVFGAVSAVQALRRGSGGGDAALNQTVPRTAAVGSMAPAFILKDHNGVPYVLTPGDDNAHLLVFYMGYFWGGCRSQLGELASREQELERMAEVVAISVDPPDESQKTDKLLNSTFPLLQDKDLKVICSYQMEHSMGSETVGNMGYVIIDRQGVVRKTVIDPSFGQHYDSIMQELKNA